jgi:hypothetical protein
MLEYPSIHESSHTILVEIIFTKENYSREVTTHLLIVTNMRNEGALSDTICTNNWEDARIVRTLWLCLQQETDDTLQLRLPAEHGHVQEQVGAVRLAVQGRVGLEQHNELSRVSKHGAQAMQHLLQLQVCRALCFVGAGQEEALGRIEFRQR